MLIRNPGSAHFDAAGAALLTFADYNGPDSTVDSIDNDPASEN